MSGLDVEALLDSTASGHNGDSRDKPRSPAPSSHGRHDSDHDSARDRHRSRRDRSSDRGSRLGGEGDRHANSPSHESSSRRRSRSRDSHRSRRARDSDHAAGRPHTSRDHNRGERRYRSRSRSPRRDYDRHYRPPPRGEPRDRDEHKERRSDRRDERRSSRSPRPHRSRSPPHREGLTEEERDRRTVFVQQLAARLRTKELAEFFETAGKVREAQIVKDRVSKRSKGVGYVEFVQEESVQKAIALTGQKLKGIPIIAQLTEAEKNRQARNPGEASTNSNSVPFHRLYVGNIHFSITENDLQNVFEPFGELEFVQLQKEETGRSRGYGFVQFRDPDQAKDALEKMNGFELAGRPIRVGLGNDKFTPESTANLLQRFQGNGGPGHHQGSTFSGSGGRGAHAGGSGAGANFDRAGGRDNDKGAGGASALDDTDVSGVNFSNYSRDALMRKLARADEPSTTGAEAKAATQAKPVSRAPPMQNSQPSRCIVLRNMFNPAEEEEANWAKELEDDIRAECEDKYGHVVHISLDADSQGDVYLKFDRAQGGENAIRGLNGRYFGGRMITAQAMVDAVYHSQFPRSKDL